MPLYKKIFLFIFSFTLFLSTAHGKYSTEGSEFKKAAQELKTSMMEQGGYRLVEITTDFEIEDIEACIFKSDHEVVLDLALEYAFYLNSFHFRNFKDVFEYRSFYVCKTLEPLDDHFENGYSIKHSFVSAFDDLRVQIYYEYNRQLLSDSLGGADEVFRRPENPAYEQ